MILANDKSLRNWMYLQACVDERLNRALKNPRVFFALRGMRGGGGITRMREVLIAIADYRPRVIASAPSSRIRFLVYIQQ